MEETFEDYLKQARNDFVEIAGTYSVGEHLKLRTAIDSLLIAYDQAVDKALNLGVVSGSYSKKQVDDAYDKGFKDAMIKYRE